MPSANQISVTVLPTGLISRKDAAAALGRSAKTLAEWKSKNIGPIAYMIGRRAFYLWTDVLELGRGRASFGANDASAGVAAAAAALEGRSRLRSRWPAARLG